MKNKNQNKYVHLQRILGIPILIIAILYLILLIPESASTEPERARNQPFSWNQDTLWLSLEKQFIKARQTGCNQFSNSIDESFLTINKLLDQISSDSLQPDAQQFSDLEDAFFNLAPLIGACPHRITDYIELFSRLRYVIKTQSIHWNMNRVTARRTIYRLLYGGRAALEEVMLQANQATLPAATLGHEEPSSTPFTHALGITIHSGDILVSRSGAPISALIARGNDYRGNFSHVSLVYVDEKTSLASIVEATVECGVKISTLEEYLKSTKLQIMVLRLRANLPQLITDPMLPHKAAKAALNEALEQHIPYDFELNCQDPTKRFCSEEASVFYQKSGIKLWLCISSISAPGIVRWLASFGVKYFETQEPSDLEYDPQLQVVAEWRDPETLFKDHLDNAVIDAMLERAESGKELNYSWYLLPIARVVKVYSSLLNVFGLVGPIPEGMSATAGLRNKKLTTDHQAIKVRTESMATRFADQYHYTAPYWKLLTFARKAVEEIDY